MEDIVVWIKSNWDWIMGSVFVFVYAYTVFLLIKMQSPGPWGIGAQPCYMSQ